MNKTVMLQQPETLTVSEDIHNPDKYIDAFASAFAGKAESMARFEAIKALDHETKVRWLLSQKDKSDEKLEPATICTIIIVTTVVMVIIGYEIVNGVKKAITEKQTKEKEVKKCVPLDE
jgi:hypothetical protein